MQAWFKPRISHNGALLEIHTNGTGNHKFQIYCLSNGKVRFNTRTTTDSSATTTSTYTASVWNHCFGHSSAVNSRECWLDNASKGSNTVSKTPAGMDRTAVSLGGGGGSQFDGELAEVAAWNVILSDDERAALANGASPLLIRPGALKIYLPLAGHASDFINGAWTVTTASAVSEHPRIVNPAPVFYSFPAAVAGGVTVTVPLGSLAITGQVPSISTGAQVSAPAGTLTIQGYVPAIQTGVSVAVPAGSLAITGQVPSISTGVSVAVPAGTLTITGQVPVITAGGVIANVPAGSLAITGQVPTVSTGVSVAVPAGALTIQGYVPSLSTGVQVSVPAGALAIQGYVPTIETGVSVAVPVGSLAITGLVPTVTAGAVSTTVSVPVGTLTITGYAPLVTSYLRSGLLAQIHTDIDGYLNTYDNLSKIVTHNAVDYRGVFTDVSAIGLQGGTNARDGPWVVMKSDDVDGTISYGDTVTIYSRDWTVEGIQPDGTGTTRLILIPAA